LSFFFSFSSSFDTSLTSCRHFFSVSIEDVWKQSNLDVMHQTIVEFQSQDEYDRTRQEDSVVNQMPTPKSHQRERLRGVETRLPKIQQDYAQTMARTEPSIILEIQ
jgi:hypothetical protein